MWLQIHFSQFGPSYYIVFNTNPANSPFKMAATFATVTVSMSYLELYAITLVSPLLFASRQPPIQHHQRGQMSHIYRLFLLFYRNQTQFNIPYDLLKLDCVFVHQQLGFIYRGEVADFVSISRLLLLLYCYLTLAVYNSRLNAPLRTFCMSFTKHLALYQS